MTTALFLIPGFLGSPVGSSQPPYSSKEAETLAKSTHNATPSGTPPVMLTTPSETPSVTLATQSGTPAVKSLTPSSQEPQQEKKEVNSLAESDMEWDGDFVSADTPESDVAMSGGMLHSGSDLESFPRTSRENSTNVTVELHKEHTGNSMKASDLNDNVPASPKNAGIDQSGQTPVQFESGALSSKSALNSVLEQKQVYPAAKSNTQNRSNSTTQEPPKTITTRTENSVDAKDDGIVEGHRSTTVAAESIGSIDEFDIDKFLEELDFDT